MQKEFPVDKESISIISSLSSRRSLEKEHKARKIFLTVLIALSYLCLGCFRAIPGPTLYILRQLAGGTKMESLMLIFTARSLGYICGYMLGGAVFDNIEMSVQRRLIISVVEILSACTAFAVPFCNGLVALSATFFGAGLTISILDTGFNTSILHMWGRKGNHYFMALHFLNGVGGLIGIILQRIFVQDISAAHAISNKTLHLVPEDMGTSTFPHLMYSFIVLCGAMCLVSLFWFLSLFCPCNELALGSFQVEADIKIPSKEFKVFAVITTALLTFLCGTISLGYQHMIATYAMEVYNLSTKSSLDLSSFFWGFYTVGGLLAIIASIKFHPFIMIIICVLLELAAGLVLILLSQSDNDMLALGNVLLGLGAGALLGWSILWMDRYIVTTYKIISALLIAESIAEMIVPPILAFALTKSTNSLSYFVLFVPIAYIIVFVLQCLWLFPHGEKFIRLSSLPLKRNKRRFFPIFLEVRRKGSDPKLVEAALLSSGIDLKKPYTVPKRETAEQTEDLQPKRKNTKEMGIQVKDEKPKMEDKPKKHEEDKKTEQRKQYDESEETDESEEPEEVEEKDKPPEKVKFPEKKDEKPKKEGKHKEKKKPDEENSKKVTVFGDLFGNSDKKTEELKQDDELELFKKSKKVTVSENLFGMADKKTEEPKQDDESEIDEKSEEVELKEEEKPDKIKEEILKKDDKSEKPEEPRKKDEDDDFKRSLPSDIHRRKSSWFYANMMH